MTLERPLPSEAADIAAIEQGILIIQARYAAEQHRPLGRGTHTKGLCVRGTFEVFDLATTIADPALAARLAKGIYAKPGAYPATIRFANGASKVQPDSDHDVRAMSFAIDVPAGVVQPAAMRLDFSMNNASTFPINDAHAFASLMKVDSASGGLAKLRALFGLPFSDIRGIFRTARQGIKQQHARTRPYQQTRYWSTVPFAHGPDDAVKYSALPAPNNLARPIGRGESVLRDELLRHINEDAQMSSFDFALQLLDPRRMTHDGKPQDATFWIENASIDWPEAEAPYVSVGRLTLTRASALPQADCELMHIDVNANSIPEHKPLGSINRARSAAESASRKARLAANPTGAAMTDESSPAPRAAAPVRVLHALTRRGGDIRLRSVFKVMAALAALAFFAVAMLSFVAMVALDRGWGMLPAESVHGIVYPDQGWGAGASSEARQTYYFTAQGAGVKDMRYSWFINLEMPWGRDRFANPAVLRRYGFLVDEPTAKNPDGLPVGFTRHFDRELNEEMLDVTCAACHTGQINVTRNGRTMALRVDGGSGLHAFTDSNVGHFVPTMLASLVSTAANPLKFNRFARKVLGDRYPEGRWTLHRQVREVIGNLAALGYHEWKYGLAPTEEGYGRTDALARISNTVFGDNLDPANYKVGNAPVNYPPVWNIWKFDWVQYNASVSQPMARNIGEAMGTGAKYYLVDRYGRPLPAAERFRSTALVENLHTIELTLRKLQPPVWNETVLGKIDDPKAQRGKALFDEHCVTCHGPHLAPPEIKLRNAPLKSATEPEWIMRTLCVDDIGTDPNTAMNFFKATVDITRTGLSAMDLQAVAKRNLDIWNQRQARSLTSEIARLKAQPLTPEVTKQIAARQSELAGLSAYAAQDLSQIHPAALPVGSALSYLGTMIREQAYADARYSAEERADRDGYGILDLPQVIPAYKPRPLAGIWATAPYLHNGSVPTIFHLLSPVDERPKTFRVGSREFDPVHLGLAEAGEDYWLFDTSLTGNHNIGHEFSKNFDESKIGQPSQKGMIGPYLSPDDRLAIIEHLKARNDDRDGPQQPTIPPPPQCVPRG
jgi:mono/diheme cytochrome c family protein